MTQSGRAAEAVFPDRQPTEQRCRHQFQEAVQVADPGQARRTGPECPRGSTCDALGRL